MKIGFLLNAGLDLKPSQTTTMLIARAARAGHAVYAFGVGDVHFGDDRAWATARRAPAPEGVMPSALSAFIAALGATETAPIELAELDAIMVRTSPGRDPDRAETHHVALDLCRLAATRGTVVLNDPDGLRRASTKLYLSHLPPEVRPATVVSSDAGVLKAFVRGRTAPTVLKPLLGTRGQDVFVVEPDERRNLNQIIDVLVRGGPAMAQAFVPEAVEGDTRVLLLEGEPLVVDSHAAAVRRIPGGDDFRSNVHVGATPAPAELTPAARRVAAAIGPTLRRDGLFLVGMDLIGERIVELNVFSSGGLSNAEEYTGADFTGAIIDALVERVRLRGR